jgi:hypothetical protein
MWGYTECESTKDHAAKVVRLCQKHIYLHTNYSSKLVFCPLVHFLQIARRAHQTTCPHIKSHQATASATGRRHIKRTSSPTLKKNSESTSNAGHYCRSSSGAQGGTASGPTAERAAGHRCTGCRSIRRAKQAAEPAQVRFKNFP